MTRQIDVALTLMRMALALLDEADTVDEGLAAVRLQQAIDAVVEGLGESNY